jgi:methylmalonyl-CoA mutase
MEIAKLRAARLLWAVVLMKTFNPKNPSSLSLRTHSQTSGWSLTAQDVYNNVVRTCVEAMAATQGHTQSLHTNALDEALALPTEFSARIARNTQLFLQMETDTCRVIDPWGGSYYVERLTHDLACRAWAHIIEIEDLGGMAKAIEAGIPKLRIEEAAAAHAGPHRFSGSQTVVGVNRFKPQRDDAIDVLKIDNTAVREAQVARLKRAEEQARCVRRERALDSADQTRPRAARGNLLELAVDAARAMATVGEISLALERPSGDTRPWYALCRGVYMRESAVAKGTIDEHPGPRRVVRAREGRGRESSSPRWDRTGTTAGRRVVASAYADMGFDVDIGPLFQTPEEVARQAIENDAHVVGVSSLAAGT